MHHRRIIPTTTQTARVRFPIRKIWPHDCLRTYLSTLGTYTYHHTTANSLSVTTIMARLSGLQKEVLTLYRHCLRETRKKPEVSDIFSSSRANVTD